MVNGSNCWMFFTIALLIEVNLLYFISRHRYILLFIIDINYYILLFFLPLFRYLSHIAVENY